MGCLNSDGRFAHWFGNIHLSGPCNRRCYFCIGQHMMALDPLNNLDRWPLDGWDEFVALCRMRGVSEINVTGTNTDPLLYQHLPKLREASAGFVLGIRTNGVLALERPDLVDLFDKGSLTVCSTNEVVNRAMMGGPPPPWREIARRWSGMFKINIVLVPENAEEVYRTVADLANAGYERINLREPYGQPHVGDPFADDDELWCGELYGMPQYRWSTAVVTYWDVHYCEVESVNLYANGRVSLTYPITRGCAPNGKVFEQDHFPGGRIQEQWLPTPAAWRLRAPRNHRPKGRAIRSEGRLT